MPRPSYDELRKRCAILTERYRKISTDPVTGLVTQPAMMFELDALEAPPTHVVMLKTPHFKQDLQKIVKIRSKITVLRVQYDDNTYLFFTCSQPKALVDGIRSRTCKRDVYANVASAPNNRPLEQIIATLDVRTQAQKEGYLA